MKENYLNICIHEGDQLFDIQFNGVSVYEIIPTVTAITIGNKTFRLDDYYDPDDEIILHLNRKDQDVYFTTEPGFIPDRD